MRTHNANNYTCLIQHMLYNQHLNTHPECKINWRANIVSRRRRHREPKASTTTTMRASGGCNKSEKKRTRRHWERDQSIIRRSFPSVSNTTWNQTQSTYQNRNIKHENRAKKRDMCVHFYTNSSIGIWHTNSHRVEQYAKSIRLHSFIELIFRLYPVQIERPTIATPAQQYQFDRQQRLRRRQHYKTPYNVRAVVT